MFTIYQRLSLPLRLVSRIVRWSGLASFCLGLSLPGMARSADTGQLPGYVVLPLVRAVDAGYQACIRVQINGHSTLLVLDTGAYGTVLDAGFYRSIRTSATVNPDQLPPEMRGKLNANGEKAEAGYIQSMTSGAMNFGQGPVSITDLSRQFGRSNGIRPASAISGLLGQDILHKYGAIIDWSRQGVYFNTDPSKRVNVGRAFAAAGWTAIPMSPTNGRHHTVQCTIEGKPVRLLVDTGSRYTDLREGVMPLPVRYNHDTGDSMAHIATPGAAVSMIGLDTMAYFAHLEHWKIGGYELTGTNVVVHKFPARFGQEQSAGDGPLLGLLGANLLASNNGVIDIANSTLYLKHPAR